MKQIMIVFWMALLPASLTAQESNFGNWLIYLGNKKITDKWNLHHEVQYRNYNFIGDTEQLLLRAGIGYNLSEKNNNLLIGYGFIHSQNYMDTSDMKSDVNEHRIYQQFTSSQKFGRLSLQHRYRIEERFITTQFKVRFRYFLSAKVVLNKPKMEKNTVYLSAYNEIFIGTKNQFFDRNRLYGGLGYAVTDKLKFEAGYMTQLFQGSHRDQLNIICALSF